jgi:hypothetical protein
VSKASHVDGVLIIASASLPVRSVMSFAQSTPPAMRRVYAVHRDDSRSSATAIVGAGSSMSLDDGAARDAPELDTVHVRLDSTPRGASVYNATGVVIGVTPMVIKVARSDREMALVIKHGGYRD